MTSGFKITQESDIHEHHKEIEQAGAAYPPQGVGSADP